MVRRCNRYILGYSDAIKLQRRGTDAVTELVLRCCVFWPNRLGWRQKVLQPPSMFMLLSWWCPLGQGKRHMPAIQIFIAVRLIPILTHLSSRWTVPLICFLLIFHVKVILAVVTSQKKCISYRNPIKISRCTAKTLDRKLETNIPRNEIARPRYQFLHSCIWEWFIYSQSHDWSAYLAAAK